MPIVFLAVWNVAMDTPLIATAGEFKLKCVQSWLSLCGFQHIVLCILAHMLFGDLRKIVNKRFGILHAIGEIQVFGIQFL